MPHERTRSIIQARDFLVDLSHDQVLNRPGFRRHLFALN
ncbi:BPSL0761 family protein [Pseudomonas sp. P1.8]|nr:BPSL0761 family protein [Pseudomonas sp. P1.8]